MFFDDEEDYTADGGDRLVKSTKGEYDVEENVLRPKTLEAYVGQAKVKENLKVYMKRRKTEGRGSGTRPPLRRARSRQNHFGAYNRKRDGRTA